MASAKKASAKAAGHFRFILFVAGQEPNSVLALQNLRILCQEHFPDRHTIEIVDVFHNMDAAIRHNILITPTLIKKAPDPTSTIFGNLNDTRAVMALLLP
jgi:circadian clock protein KaiB